MANGRDETMTAKLMGAVLVIAGCGGFGFSMAAAHVREERYLRCLISALEAMRSDLTYRLMPLPELCRFAGKTAGGTVGSVFMAYAAKLEAQISPDAQSCMNAVLENYPGFPKIAGEQLHSLGTSLGCFSLEGQLKGLDAVISQCKRELEKLGEGRAQRLRGYQTLGLCAGAAIAILFV